MTIKCTCGLEQGRALGEPGHIHIKSAVQLPGLRPQGTLSCDKCSMSMQDAVFEGRWASPHAGGRQGSKTTADTRAQEDNGALQVLEKRQWPSSTG